jgi:tRNA pseudouridine13 synthase
MKLRQIPEDFRVEEICDISISKTKKDFAVYLLEKKGVETFSLIRHLSKQNSIPPEEFGIAGLKDRHAITRQHITVPSKYAIKNLSEDNFSMTLIGYSDKRISLGDLSGNHFEITARGLRKGELDGIAMKSKDIEVIGVPNYFDSQRFGSVIGTDFIAKRLVQKDYEGAVRIFLTKFTASESSKIKSDKKRIAATWGSLSEVKVETPALAAVIAGYAKKKSWIDAYKKIDHNLREMYISAYNSFLWNECVKRLLILNLDRKKIYTIEYSLGNLLFYKNMKPGELERLPKTFQTVSEEMKPKEHEAKIVSQVLSREGLTIQDFGIKKETGSFFRTHEREVVVRPKDFSISEPVIDELNDHGKNNVFKVTVKFSLPKGSYATIVTKRIFNS